MLRQQTSTQLLRTVLLSATVIVTLMAMAPNTVDARYIDQSSTGMQRTNPPCRDADDCRTRDVGAYRLFDRNLNADGAYYPVETSTVEGVMEKGLSEAGMSPTHIALRGTGNSDSVRCQFRGVSRTLEQREQTIRFWLELDDQDPLPSPQQVEQRFMTELDRINVLFPQTIKANFRAIAQGGLSTDYLFLTCFIDYTALAYSLGSGPNTLTVAYDQLAEARSYALYELAHAAGEFGDPVTTPKDTEAQYRASLDTIATTNQALLSNALGGRENIIFAAPMGAHSAIAFEAWRVIAQWDLQVDEAGTVQAVRYGSPQEDPEHMQTLANLKTRITAAATTDAFADDRIANISGLNQYYRTIGAYGDITPGDGSDATFMPAMPPPVPTCAGSTAVGTDPEQDLVDDCNTLLDSKNTLAGTATLNWSKDLAMSSWDGITLSGNRVGRIILTDKDLDGVIPAELGDLTGLTRIDLDENELTGEIPAQLGNLKQMTHLYLFDNALTGSIPPELGHMTALQVLYLEDNALTGSVPTEIGDLSNLTQLILGDNELSGDIPDEIAGISTLRHLSVRDNNHTGQIPRGLSAIPFTHLSLSGNSFTGCLPTGMETADPQANDLWRAELTALPSCGPDFSQATYTFSAARTSAAGDTVGTTTATPWDTDGTVAHAITAGNESSLFQMNQATGEITLARAPAGTDSDAHTLTVQGTDAHGQGGTATVAITLTP